MLINMAEDFGLIDEATATAMRGVESTLADFAVSGDVDAAEQRLETLARYAAHPYAFQIGVEVTGFGEAMSQLEALMNRIGGARAVGQVAAETGATEGYQQGTTWVPRTGLAMVHAGEEIVPRGRMGGHGGEGTIILAPIIMEKGDIEDQMGGLNAEALIGAILEQAAM